MKARILKPVLAFSVLLVGCRGGARGDSPDLFLEEAWARAMPFVSEGQESPPNSAVYVLIQNRGGSGDRLTGAETEAARVVEVHETRVVDDVMRMRKVEALEIPANDTVRLEPGGLHIMLLGLTRPLREGDALDLTLHFEVTGDVAVSVPVRLMAVGS